jgi:hypothetical protein
MYQPKAPPNTNPGLPRTLTPSPPPKVGPALPEVTQAELRFMERPEASGIGSFLLTATAGPGGSATATATSNNIQAMVHTSSPARPPTPTTSTFSQEESSGSQTTPLPGSAPGTVNGRWSESAGIDHDQDEWTPLMKGIWPDISADLGKKWKVCLAQFVDFERKCGFKVSSLLELCKRLKNPKLVQVWLFT